MLEALVGELTRKSNWFEQNVPILCENKPAHWLWLIGFWLHTLVNLFNFLAKAKNLQDTWGPHTNEGWKKSILLHRFSCLLHAIRVSNFSHIFVCGKHAIYLCLNFRYCSFAFAFLLLCCLECNQHKYAHIKE